MDLGTFVILALLGVSGTFAAPTDSSRCAGECTQVYNPKFDYSPGKTYTYSYDSSTALKLSGVTTDEPGLKLSATAEISVLTPCEFALKLSNVRLSGSKNVPTAGDFKKIVEERPLLFSFTDGRVNHVCPDPKDPTWSVNVKRGVLSTFQNTMDKNLETYVREVDIAGQCDTQYEVTATTGKGSTVNKRKDLATCTKRVGRITSLQGNPYASFSRVQSPPLTKSSQNCVHVLANNIIQSVECEELHILRLFARGELGATTIAKTKLTYVKQAKGSPKNLPRKVGQSGLLFDHAEDVARVTDDVAETIAVLKNICEKTTNDLSPSAATDFTRLVYLVRRLRADSIRSLIQQLESGLCSNPKTKDIFLGAVNQAGTEGAVQVTVHLLNNNKIVGLRARLWITSLAFIQRPTSGTIEAVIPLIDSPNPNRVALLSVSSIVHTFCRRNDDCEKDKAVQKLIEKLGRHLGYKCKANNANEEDKVISALKAFGNIGHFGKFLTVIQDCLKEPSLNVPIRLAAIDAFRRAPYDEITNLVFIRILEDQSQNTELRIASYLALMRHPCGETIQKIKWILDREILNQVNSFIWTHLKNLQKSKSPVKYDIRKLVKNLVLEKKYVDGRKFSKNYGASFYSDKLNAGGAVDGNIIFTPESFLPRSASLNLTLDLFGHSIDLLEVDVRAVNLEHRIESYFGPTGKVNVNSEVELKSKLRDRWRKISEGIENEASSHGKRHRRDALHNTAKFKELQSKAAIKQKKEPEGSLSLKIFGNEIRWYDFHSLDEIYDREDPYNLKDILNRLATHKELDVTRNFMFLDTTSTIPTASGFPLRFDLNGTASIALKLQSHFDVRQFLLSPRHADIKSLIQPSASIELAGSLIIDAGVVKTGLKLASNLYSSTAIDGTLLIKEGEFTAKLDLPKENQDLIKVKSNLYLVDGDKETPVTPASTTRYELQGCSKRIGSLIGVELCTVISLPRPLVNPQRPYLPLGGPLEYGVSLRKTNPEFQGYHFTALYNQPSPTDVKFKVSFNTPGSTKDREYSIDYEVQQAKQVRLNLRTPYKKVSLSGDFIDGGSTRETNLVMKVDDEREYAFHGKTGIVHQGDTVIFNPTWEIVRPNSPKVVLTGTIKRTPSKKLEFDMRDAPNSERKPIKIKGVCQREGDGSKNKMKAECDIELVTPDIQNKISASIETEDTVTENKREIQFNYEYERKGQEKRALSFKIQRETKLDSDGYKYYRFSEWKWSRFPEYNVRTTIHLERDEGEFTNLIDSRWGPNFEDESNSFHLEHRNKIKRVGRGAFDGTGSLQLIYPRRNINWDMKTKLSFQANRLLDYDLTLKYAKDKALKVSFEWKNESSRLMKYTSELKIEVPTREIVIRDSAEDKGSGQYEGVTYIQWQRGESITINSSYKNKGTIDTSHHELEVVVNLKDKQIRKYTALLHSDSKQFLLNGKVVKPDKTYEVDIKRNSPDSSQASSEITLKLPWVEGVVKGSRNPTELTANVDLKTENRRVVGSLNLKPKTLNVSFKWDADRDEKKKVDMVIKIERRHARGAKIMSVTSLPNRVIKADIDYELPDTLFNGDHHIKADIEYEPGQKLNIDAKFNIDKNQEARRVSNGVISINKGLANGFLIDYNTDYQRLPEERRFNAHFDIRRGDESGNDLVLEINHIRGNHKLDSSIELKHAHNDLAFKLGLIADLDIGSEDGLIIGGGLELKTPTTGPLSDFALVIREGYKRSHNSADFIHENRLRLGTGNEFGLALEWKRRSPSHTGMEYSGRFELDTPFESLRSYKVASELIVQRGDPYILSAKLEAAVGTERSFKSALRCDRKGNKVNGYLLLDSSRVPGAFEVTLSSDDLDSGKYSTELTIKYGEGKVIRVVRKLTIYNDGRRHASIVITTPSEVAPTIRATVDLQTAEKKTSISADVDWGTGKNLQATGDLNYFALGEFNGQIKVNSEALGLADVSVSANGKIVGEKKTLSLKFNFGPDRSVDVHASRDAKPGNVGSVGELAIKINSEDFLTIKLDIEDTLSKKSPVGRLLAFRTEIHNPMISTAIHLVVLSEKGVNPTLKICTLDLNKCIILETLIDRDVDDKKLGTIDNNFHVKVIVQRAPGDTRTVGLIARTNQLRNTVERSLKLAWNEEEKKFIGLNYVAETTGDANKPGYNRKYQILLPSRTIEARSDLTRNEKGYVYNLHLLLDAAREPKRELTVNVDAKVTSSGESLTRISKITVKHPEMKNDLVITNELRLKQERILFAQKTEFDLTGKKVTIDIEVIDVNKSPSGFNYTYLFGIRQSAAKNLDLKIRGHRAKTDEGRTFGFELFWLNKDGVPKTYTIFSEIDKVNHVINGMIRTPIRVFDWKGTYEKLEPDGLHGVRANLDFNYNNKLVRRAHIEYSSRPSINLKYYSNPADINRLFRLHGGLLDDENFEISATRVKDGQTVHDLSLLVHLNSSRMLFNRFKWRPGILQDIREGIDARSAGLSKGVEEAVQNFAELAQSEVSDKSEVIRSVLKTQLVPVLASTGQRLAAIHEELQKDLQPGKLDRLKDVLDALVSNFVDVDALIAHIQAVRQQYRDSLSARLARLGEILSRLGGILDSAVDKLVDALANLPARIQAWRANARSRIPELVDRIGAVMANIRDLLNGILQDRYVSKSVALFRELWDEIVEKTKDWLQTIGSLGTGAHWWDDDNADVLYEKIKAKLYEYSEREGELPKVVKGILTAIRTVKEKIQEVIDSACQTYYEYRAELLRSWSDIYNEYQNNPDFQALVEELRVYGEQLKETYLKDEEEDKKSLKAQVREVTDTVLERTRERIAYLTGKDGVFDPKNGLIEYYIPLPVPIDSLRNLRQGFSLKRLFERDDRQSLKQALNNALERLKPHFTPEKIRETLPPFDGYAVLIGNQHFKTFDDRFYDFSGPCSYVLTEDLVDNNFTVILTYGQGVRGQRYPVKDSLLVISDYHNIVIKPGFKVSLDDQEVELPIQIEKTVVWRKGGKIQVDNNKGFTAVYDATHDFISVNISGFYFGKVGGLFGTYNNEPSDDFRQPEGQNLTSVDQFANSWEVSDRCASKTNHASDSLSQYGSEAYDLCHKTFSSMWSPLEDCFDHVKPDHFLQVCLEETSPQLSAVGGNLCKVIGAYIHTCEQHNIQLETPLKCLICESPDGKVHNALEKHNLRNDKVPKSADVMFIIEQKECNRPILVESLDEVARELDRELHEANGLRDNRYGVVAFGGEGSHEKAHTHTAGGQLFNDARSVVLALKNMAFSGTEQGDAFGAIDLAARYPFRPGVAKIGLLFLCSRCSEKSQSVDYSGLQKRLLETGFTLHVLIPEEFKMKSKSQLASLIIGIDAQTTYKGKDIGQKNLVGESDLRPHLTGVKDLCFTLAQEVGGSVFRSDLFETRKTNVGKNVKGVFVRRVALNAQPSTCQTCSCEDPNSDGVGHPICRLCTIPKPQTLYGLDDDSEEDDTN